MSGLAFGSGGIVVVYDEIVGTTSSLAGSVVARTSAGFPQSAGTALFDDTDSFPAPAIANFIQYLVHGLTVASDDNIALFPFATVTARYGLTAALVTDADAFYVPAFGAPLAPALITDSDSFPAPTIRAIPVLRPGLIATDDAFFVPTIIHGSVTVRPSRVIDADSFLFPWYVTRIDVVPSGPQQKLKPPPKVQDFDIFFSPSISKMSSLVVDPDIFRVPLVTARANLLPTLVNDVDTIPAVGTEASSQPRPALMASDDEVFGALISMILQPALLDSDDEIGAADVGWQVIADFTEDADEVYEPEWLFLNELLPDVWRDEENFEGYPFFVQALSGGVPVPPRLGVLTGSIKRSPHLTGSIASRRAA